MTGKKRKATEVQPPGDSGATEDTEMSLKKSMGVAVRELHRAQRKLNSLVESAEITAEYSDDIFESLDQLTERLDDIGGVCQSYRQW